VLTEATRHYGIGYAVVSTIFIANALGFILAAFVVDVTRSRLGRARTLILANTFMICGYIPIVFTPPFPVVVCCFFLLGLGMAIVLSLGNVFAANLQNSTNMLGIMHGSYGVGGTIGPLIATGMVASGGWLWSRYYILTLGFTIFNMCLAGWSFWNFEAQLPQPSNLMTPMERTPSRIHNSESAAPVRVKTVDVFRDMLKAFKNKTVILGALFIFAYQGAEVSISGWVISFLINFRHGDPSKVGYVSSGFWAGITIGRFLLSGPAHKIGEKIFVYFLIGGAATMQLLIWFVPNVIGDAVAVALVGLLLGPIYPCAAYVFTRAISHKEHVSSLSVISAFGSSGGAVAPFTTGILAQAVGTFVLHPIVIGLLVVMTCCWYALPRIRKRTE
jgi:fucose permease